HCQEGDPEKCGNELAEHILDKYGEAKVAHIGYQPGHLEACSKHFDSQVTDMNTKNIGEEKFGVKVIDASENERVIKEADVACITGSTITNGTLPELLEWCETYETEPIVYGVTCRGAAEILGLETFCPYGRDNF
ncbi:MAG: hypothetical protein KGY45_04735, partial [Hadesarchaea archaeon]|nr:hypothetical protein [Hadesarchaea archaeon]